MNHLSFATHLIRLGRHKIGVAEATTLFCLGAGSTIEEIGRATSTHHHQAKGRISALRAKRLVKTIYGEDGIARYTPTDKGLEIIKRTLKP